MRPGSAGPGAARGSGPGLTRRLTLAMVAVVLLVFVIAALLTRGLFASSVEDSARSTLARQADLIAELPTAAGLTNRLDAQSDVGGLYLGVVAPRGRVSGAASALTVGQVDRLLSGRTLSTTAELDGERVLVEARPVARGGAIVLATSDDETDRAISRFNLRLLVALLLGALVALVAGVLTARYLGRPLARLAGTARRMGAGERGVVPEETPSSGWRTREVEEVADALRQLDAALVTSEGRQRRFLLSVSHELRTPLTAVRGYAESLAEGVIPTEDVADVAHTMVAESVRMGDYVADLLALARLEADDFAVRLALVDLGALVAEASTAWTSRAGARGITMTAEVDPSSGAVTSDAARLRQVLDALVDNAVRVCPAGARIVLAAGPGRLEVRDSGPGLTPDDVTVAFEPGVLHDRYAGERPGGHGLGLAIVHRLVTRLGGTIGVREAAEGGAAFRIELPGGGGGASGAGGVVGGADM